MSDTDTDTGSEFDTDAAPNAAATPTKAETEAAGGMSNQATLTRRREDMVDRFKAEALDRVSTAIMMVDRDFKLVYMNAAAYDLMKGAEPAFRDVWPGFSADNLMGECIDKFHANPAHQRRLLSNPENLPYSADIEVAGLSFGLTINAQINDDGEYVGSTLEWEDLTQFLELEAKMDSVNRGQVTVEFALDGTILGANQNMLDVMGYTLDEIKGRHHRIFVDPVEAAESSYRAFWETLSRGQMIEGEFNRLTKSGSPVWLRGQYSAVLDRSGKPVKIIKMANVVTEEKQLREQIDNILARASLVMEAVANGDLTETIDGTYEGNLAQLQEATNASIETLAGLVLEIRRAADSMSNSAGEVAEANQDLSRRTEAQASALEETASSMEEMTATVQQNADNARQASQLAVGAREQAQQGGQVVDQAVEAMRAISDSSKKIADIIGVIDEIAFQTNLLALNAAVEAARAGDQGRGFAVVASEVRNLAQRSAGAAKEIKALIQDSLEKVDGGADLVNRSGAQLTEIVGSVKKVSDIVAEIAAASEEQSAGINQVNQAVAQMDQGTQQNAAMVEEAAAASESVQQQAHGLLNLVERFRMSGSADLGPRVDAPPAPATRARSGATESARPAPTSRPDPVASSDDDDVWQEF